MGTKIINQTRNMQKITCSQLKIDLAEIKDLKNEFDLEVEKIIQTRNTEHALAIQKKIEEKLTATKEKIFPKEIKAIFTNPETNEQKEIVFNIKEKIKEAQEFYKNHNLPIPNEQEIKKIFRGSKAEIQKEIAMYGYDNILIIPENLPSTEKLHEQMSKDYNATWTGSSFDQGGGFTGAKTTSDSKARIILCHSDENVYENDDANPFNKATLDKSIRQLSGLTQEEIDRRVENNEEVPVSFEAVINGKKTQIKSEGLSLNEYLIFQRQYFEKTNKHLDSNGWTWLPKTRSGSRFVGSSWDPGDDQLLVVASDAGGSLDYLGCRLSRSFSA